MCSLTLWAKNQTFSLSLPQSPPPDCSQCFTGTAPCFRMFPELQEELAGTGKNSGREYGKNKSKWAIMSPAQSAEIGQQNVADISCLQSLPENNWQDLVTSPTFCLFDCLFLKIVECPGNEKGLPEFETGAKTNLYLLLTQAVELWSCDNLMVWETERLGYCLLQIDFLTEIEDYVLRG